MSGSRVVRVRGDLQQDFSLHQSLSLYLVEAAVALDRNDPSYVLDMISLVEAILENPRPILQLQVRKARGELLAKLKAEGIPYEDRISRLDELTWPKPAAEFIYTTFNLFAEIHPWVGEENIQPKSIAREMFESYTSFNDYVGRYELQRVEGLLLRHLAQVHGTLVRTVPESARTEEVFDAIAFFRKLLARVDSSLIEEWERQLEPAAKIDRESGTTPPKAPPARIPLESHVRAELHQLVHALAAQNWDEAAGCVRQDPDDPWDAARFEAALQPFYQEYARIVFDPPARQKHHTLIEKLGPQSLDVRQVLVDPAGDNMWNREGEVRLGAEESPTDPIVRVRRIGT